MAYTLISEQVLGSAVASVTFSSIPGTYRDLVLEVVGSTTSTQDIDIQFNGDAATNYSRTYVAGNGTAASSGRDSNTNLFRVFYMGAAGGAHTAHVMNYANTTTYKTILSRSADAGIIAVAYVGLWRSTAAITSLVIKNESTTTYNTGSAFRLWGVS